MTLHVQGTSTFTTRIAIASFVPYQCHSLIPLIDIEDIDYLHEFDNDKDKEDSVYRVVEMKPIIISSCIIVKVEKDWWAIDAEKWEKRIV